ncbi:hypothetical protein DAPPUDRAFT_326568 [Daphnia pulex]|uniref:SWIM-type domain-containing protein n=1 Tax=Daphnia pulex TaxID=6669 RepID=E9H849_DAPPU|nr:hypothetical protein DAPPUDRAFT_326568 [Daphnia pulex]|eukprot:EFX72090.1 hypothetical protein DAPPUDRAFT_326568 [Daphnia pulex]
MASSQSPLNSWVALLHQGNIHSGHCDCKTGLSGTCSHNGVVLWGLVNLSEETVSKISSLKTAKRGTIFDRKYDESSDDTFILYFQQDYVHFMKKVLHIYQFLKSMRY